MPDRADVEKALAGLIANAIYRDGTDAGSAIGPNCRVYRGWPVPRMLEEELSAGVVHITVQPVSGSARDRTRFSSEWQGTRSDVTLSGTVDGSVVAFSGPGGLGHVAGVKVDSVAYAYRMRSGDSAELVAAALADQIRADRPALALGSQLYLADGRDIVVRVMTDGVGGRELRRQECGFRITFWCPDPNTRDQAAALVDITLAEVMFIDVIGWACRIQLAGNSSTDEGSAGGIWRRDLIYNVEYPTTVPETLAAMLFGITDVNSNPFVD